MRRTYTEYFQKLDKTMRSPRRAVQSPHQKPPVMVGRRLEDASGLQQTHRLLSEGLQGRNSVKGTSTAVKAVDL